MAIGSDVTALTLKRGQRECCLFSKTPALATPAPVAVRKRQVPDISTFCSQLTVQRKAPAISLYTWRIIPAEALEMCSATEAKQEGPVPNLGAQSTQAVTHIGAVFSVNSNNE